MARKGLYLYQKEKKEDATLIKKKINKKKVKIGCMPPAPSSHICTNP